MLNLGSNQFEDSEAELKLYTTGIVHDDANCTAVFIPMVVASSCTIAVIYKVNFGYETVNR